MKRIEDSYIKKFKKDSGFEDVLSDINAELVESHAKYLNPEVQNQISIHIIGVPRSGTTLLTQYLATNLNVGYINNLVAAFWKVPIYGIELSKKLLGLEFQSEYKSNYGRTESLGEPHEFGYFWNSMLLYPNLMQKNNSHEKKVDWKNLNNVINNMSVAFKQPIMFKSFLLGFHANRFFLENKKSIFIYLERDKIETAHSILKLRKSLLGDEDKWGSLKPLEYDELKSMDKFHQIAGQIFYLDLAYKRQLKKVPEANVIKVNYSEFCNNPLLTLDKISRCISHLSNHSIIENIKEKTIKKSFNNSAGNLPFKTEFNNAFEFFESRIEKLSQ